MSSLHTLNDQDAARLLPYAGAGDGLLLLEDGCYLLTEGSRLSSLDPECKLYVLEDDLCARGLGGRELHFDVERIDYPAFVALCTAYDKVVNWFGT